MALSVFACVHRFRTAGADILCFSLGSLTDSHEFQYILGVLVYIRDRLSAGPSVEAAQRCLALEPALSDPSSDGGRFLELHCGHNNPFSTQEREQLIAILNKSTDPTKCDVTNAAPSV